MVPKCRDLAESLMLPHTSGFIVQLKKVMSPFVPLKKCQGKIFPSCKITALNWTDFIIISWSLEKQFLQSVFDCFLWILAPINVSFVTEDRMVLVWCFLECCSGRFISYFVPDTCFGKYEICWFFNSRWEKNPTRWYKGIKSLPRSICLHF